MMAANRFATFVVSMCAWRLGARVGRRRGGDGSMHPFAAHHGIQQLQRAVRARLIHSSTCKHMDGTCSMRVGRPCWSMVDVFPLLSAGRQHGEYEREDPKSSDDVQIISQHLACCPSFCMHVCTM